MAVTPVALDHNFPEPQLRAMTDLLPDIAFHWIKDLPPGNLNEYEDHDLIYELHRRGFPIMVTLNHGMLDDERVLIAIEQTRVTLVAIEKSGDDPVFATGVLLRDLPDVIRTNHPKGLYFRVRPTRVRPKRVRAALRDRGISADAVKRRGLDYDQRAPYLKDHPYRGRR